MVARSRLFSHESPAAFLFLAVALCACGQSVDKHLAELRSLQASGRYAETLEPLREILAKSPNNAEANYLLGVGLVQTGRTSEAVWSLRKASQSDAYAIEGGILLASALVSGQAYDEAVAATDRVIEKDPSRFTAWGVRAQAHLNAGDLPAALADSDKLNELQPKQVGGDLVRVAALLLLGRVSEAEKTYDSIVEKAKANGDLSLAARACAERAQLIRDKRHDEARAEQAIVACVDEYPTHPGVLRAASDMYTAHGRAAEGTKLWQAATQLAPDSIPLRLGLAQDLARRGLNDEAEATLLGLAKDFSSSFEAWKALADFQRSRGALDRALESLDKAVNLSGGNERLRFERGDLLIARGDLDGAEAVVTSLPDGAPRELLRGELLYARKDFAQAFDALETGLARWPENVGAHVLAGQTAEQLRDRERALTEYRTALRLDPSNAAARIALASALLSSGNPADAAVLVGPVAQESSPWRPAALRVLALARADGGDAKGAREAATTLRALPGSEAAGWVLLAGLERKSGGEAAVVYLLEHADLDYTAPANAEALRALVDGLFATGRSDAAAARADRAVAAHPDVPAFLDLQGRVLVKLGKPEQARANFDKASKLDPNYAPAVAGLATLEALSGNRDRAIELFDRASSLEPRDGSNAYSAAQLTLAAGRREDAERRLRSVVEHNPEVMGAANDLAYILAERGADLDLALRLADRAVASEPTAETLDTLGYVRLKRGEYERAAEAFRRSLDKKPDAPTTSYHLGLALKEAGDRDGARAAFQKALGAGAFPDRARAESELVELGATAQEAHR